MINLDSFVSILFFMITVMFGAGIEFAPFDIIENGIGSCALSWIIYALFAGVAVKSIADLIDYQNSKEPSEMMAIKINDCFKNGDLNSAIRLLQESPIPEVGIIPNPRTTFYSLIPSSNRIMKFICASSNVLSALFYSARIGRYFVSFVECLNSYSPEYIHRTFGENLKYALFTGAMTVAAMGVSIGTGEKRLLKSVFRVTPVIFLLFNGLFIGFSYYFLGPSVFSAISSVPLTSTISVGGVFSSLATLSMTLSFFNAIPQLYGGAKGVSKLKLAAKTMLSVLFMGAIYILVGIFELSDDYINKNDFIRLLFSYKEIVYVVRKIPENTILFLIHGFIDFFSFVASSSMFYFHLRQLEFFTMNKFNDWVLHFVSLIVP